MPRVVDYAPAWLSRPSPAASFFSSSSSTNGADQPGESYLGPTKVLARRDTEVFAVVDGQIRWSDLTLLKDEWQESVRHRRHGSRHEEEDAAPLSGSPTVSSKGGASNKFRSTNGVRGDSDTTSQYRILTVPIYGNIKQLIPSPNGAFLAILTVHTIHIAVLPDSSHLSGPDHSPIRLRTYQLGPATHVIPESPVVSALWHPLGVYDNHCGCIVTVTADSALRVWEIDRRDNWSFDRPAIAIDLKKLIDGRSCEDDFAPSRFGQNKGFSVDSSDMEVASASFGGRGYDDEDAWASMTFWIAMRQGDVYALCPLLPSKWHAPSLTIPSLKTSVVHALAAAQDDTFDHDKRKVLDQQYEWLREIDNQEPIQPDSDSGLSEIRPRPSIPSPIPRLQGPFQFTIEEEPDDFDVTDMFVIAAKPKVDGLLIGEDGGCIFNESSQNGVSGTVLCLVTENGVVHIGLEMHGVEGQWLPHKSQNKCTTPVSESMELLLLESLQTVRGSDQQRNCWPTFSEDIGSRYNFFVTTANAISFISLSSWAHRLEPELQSEDTVGSAFRIGIMCDSSIAEGQQIIQVKPAKQLGNFEHLTNSLIFHDFDLGYMLLTYTPSEVCALILESSAARDSETTEDIISSEPAASVQQTHLPTLQRAPYQVPSLLYSTNPLVSFVNDHVPHGHRHTLKEPIRLSPSTLDTMTAAHRILSSYSHALEIAASDLFRRCERLQGEIRYQLDQLIDIAGRINDVSQGTVRRPVQSSKTGREGALDSRMAAVESTQKKLTLRYHNLRSKLLRAGGRPISDREKGWIQEVGTLSNSIGADDGDARADLIQRFKTFRSLKTELQAKALAESLSTEARRLSGADTTTIDVDAQPTPLRVPRRLREAKVVDAMNMVEREAAVIEAITSRLERLNTGTLEF
ncbi:hypothetical protein LOZ52_002013 [Ophidiomyces ophidiicola]|uniref:Uncharacterized protein n=1 Tax=Ophidiomyces ophidiicola TaxID=1387563 RepID=A0ACB8V041_9EURO|nr:hypothetical protein LOZ59_000334 [Ophidiomyces ophidiicola]KAI2007730.1 hypothetical protein LOZ50_002389 [Ophidiomyces ophidiicola]KAI2039769.1 hypothetical protein LOZ47_001982 [Ophidiomyces ophidiicola]KAI2127219.1 hypothetical protein LOZ31_002748 [Ophidiomyces ophidiicola]KAI2200071.1 hypothetical protein LOZ20_001758 [Ophidiomyces ophidiicola]